MEAELARMRAELGAKRETDERARAEAHAERTVDTALRTTASVV